MEQETLVRQDYYVHEHSHQLEDITINDESINRS